MSKFLRPYEPQYARLPCQSITPRACSNSCPLSWWCHPTIPSSVTPFSSCPQSFRASESLPMSQFFTFSLVQLLSRVRLRRPHGLLHSRLPCPSPTPGVYSNLCPLNWWCHPTISSSDISFSSCLQSFPVSGSFPRSQFFASSGLEFQLQYQSFQWIFRTDFLFRMDWLDLLAVQGTLRSLFQHHSSKALILQCSAFFIVQLAHPYMTTGKTIVLTRQTFVGKVLSLLFNVALNRWVLYH